MLGPHWNTLMMETRLQLPEFGELRVHGTAAAWSPGMLCSKVVPGLERGKSDLQSLMLLINNLLLIIAVEGLELDSVKSQYSTVRSGCLDTSPAKTVKWGSVLGKVTSDRLPFDLFLCTQVGCNRERMLQTNKSASCLGTKRNSSWHKHSLHPQNSPDFWCSSERHSPYCPSWISEDRVSRQPTWGSRIGFPKVSPGRTWFRGMLKLRFYCF